MLFKIMFMIADIHTMNTAGPPAIRSAGLFTEEQIPHAVA